MDKRHPSNHYPDGLTEQLIDALLTEVDAAVVAGPHPTSALLDGTATERRFRRQERHSVTAVVRALPLRRVADGPDGRAA